MVDDQSRKPKRRYHRVSHAASQVIGSACVLAVAVAGTAAWIGVGVWTAFPTQWFMLTNLLATIAVFLTLLLLQHSRRMQMRSIHAKLDELIRSGNAGNHMIASERLADELLDELRVRHRERVLRGD